MRLVTRADFDGLACAVFLKEAGVMDDIFFAEPSELQNGRVPVGPNDILANVPFVPGAGMWFDHHVSEVDRLRDDDSAAGVEGLVKRAPSCAHVIWDYYQGEERFPARLAELLEAADKVDSAQLSIEDIDNPKDYVLLGLILDPRTGLDRCCRLDLSREDLVRQLVEPLRTQEIAKVLALPEVKGRLREYFEQTRQFKEMLQAAAKLEEGVLVIDLRHVPDVHAGNRFIAYALFPEAKVSVLVDWDDEAHEQVLVSVGHSIVNRTCKANVGRLMLKYGGGGHLRVGTCKLPSKGADATLIEIVDHLKKTC